MENYTARINKVIDYIETNLEKNLTLDELAREAGFSKYHFHRIFYSIMGETLFKFITRIRLEKAALRLVTEFKIPVTTIALECGFASSASFSKSFKENFNTTPTAWRKQKLYSGNSGQQNSNLSKIISNNKKDISLKISYINNESKTQRWEAMDKNNKRIIEIKEHPETTVIYIRHIGPYKQDVNLFEQLSNTLFKWAAARDLFNPPETEYLIISHDDPELTDDDKLRISVCLTAPHDVQTDGQIGKMIIPAGKYAHLKFTVHIMEIQQAWDWAFGSWLPQSGYVPDEGPCYESYPLTTVNEAASDTVDLEICIPVKPME